MFGLLISMLGVNKLRLLDIFKFIRTSDYLTVARGGAVV
jgi:hypothetical protein